MKTTSSMSPHITTITTGLNLLTGLKGKFQELAGKSARTITAAPADTATSAVTADSQSMTIAAFLCILGMIAAISSASIRDIRLTLKKESWSSIMSFRAMSFLDHITFRNF